MAELRGRRSPVWSAGGLQLRAHAPPPDGAARDPLARSGLTGASVNLFVSAAGYSPSVREDFMDAANEVVPTLLGGGIRVTGFANDATSLLLGHDADGVIIAGTGSNVLVRSRDGELHQIGGHEWVACDYGSGFWIGLNAIRRAYRDWEEGNDTVLLQRLHQEYGIREDDEKRLIAKLPGPGHRRQEPQARDLTVRHRRLRGSRAWRSRRTEHREDRGRRPR